MPIFKILQHIFLKIAFVLGFFLILLFNFSCSKEVSQPTAAFTVEPQTGDLTTTFVFDASSSWHGSGAEVSIKQYLWDFNSDGNWDFISDTSAVAKHQFTTAGTQTVTLKIRNSQGYTAATTRIFEVADVNNQAPNAPTNPIPDSGAVSQPINLTLSWQCTDPDGDVLIYKLYFGDQSDPPLLQSGLTTNSYDLTQLVLGKTYYWKIVALDSHSNSSSSEIWSFRTKADISQCPASFTDVRNNKKYTGVVIGDQCWMGENLNYGTKLNPANEQTDNQQIEKYCYNNLESNCDTYGGLYQWDELMNYLTIEGTQGICPAGWHIPTEAEWNQLVSYLGGNLAAGKELKTGGSSNFDALMAGTRLETGGFSSLGNYAYFWSSTERDTTHAFQTHIATNFDAIFFTFDSKKLAKSVRCIKD